MVIAGDPHPPPSGPAWIWLNQIVTPPTLGQSYDFSWKEGIAIRWLINLHWALELGSDVKVETGFGGMNLETNKAFLRAGEGGRGEKQPMDNNRHKR